MNHNLFFLLGCLAGLVSAIVLLVSLSGRHLSLFIVFTTKWIWTPRTATEDQWFLVWWGFFGLIFFQHPAPQLEEKRG